jgi:hypothetical protein
MSQHKCELCGTPVKIVGKTTKHYEPLVSVASVPVSNEVISWLKLHYNPTEEEAHCYKLLFEYLNTVPPAASGPSVLEIETILDKEIESCCDKSKAAFATYALLIVKGER